MENNCFITLCWFLPYINVNQFKSLSRVLLFATPWTAARQASLSITNSWSLPKPMSTQSVMPSNHLVLPLSSFPSSHVWMWELDYWESWALKNWCFWTSVLEKTLESPLDRKEIYPVHPKGNQSWIFIGRTDADAKTPILWPPDAKNWLIGKDPDAGKDWRWEKTGMTKDEMVGWYHRLNWHEFELALGVGHGQGSLVCYNPRGCKELDTTERLKWTELIFSVFLLCASLVLLQET